MAVEGACSFGGGGAVDMRPDLADDGVAEGNVGDEVAVHDVDVQPVGALGHGGAAGRGGAGRLQDGGSGRQDDRHGSARQLRSA